METIVNWSITNKCNLNCKYCITNSNFVTNRELSNNDLRSLANDIGDFGVNNVDFTGGEPFYHSFFVELVEILSEYDNSIMVVSNGTLIDKNISDWILKTNIDTVQISLDGHISHIHDKYRGVNTFEKAVETISLLVENDIEVNVNMVVGNHNFKYIKDTIDFCIKYKVKSFSANPLLIAGRAKEKFISNKPFKPNLKFEIMLHELEKEYKNVIKLPNKISDIKNGIKGKKTSVFNKNTSLAIDCVGNYYPCKGFFQSCDNSNTLVKNKNYEYGKYPNNKIKHAISMIQNEKIINYLDISDCNCCKYASFCRGGCPYKRLRDYGTYNIPRFDCYEYKSFIDNLIRLGIV